METILLVDGENFKGKVASILKERGTSKRDIRWNNFDFNGLLNKVLEGFDIAEKIFYFARIKEHEKTKEKSHQLIEDQRLLKTHLERTGFKVILSGRVRGQMEDNGYGKQTLVFKEKGVDVKIAVDMVTAACDKKAENIILASSDSDLQPAISEVRARKVECVYLGFEQNPNKGLTYTTNRTILIRNSEVIEYYKTQPTLV